MSDPAVDAALIQITRALVEILNRPAAPPTPNPCCSHERCRPASYSVGTNPHRCTVTPFEKCAAYVPGQGCVWGVRR